MVTPFENIQSKNLPVSITLPEAAKAKRLGAPPSHPTRKSNIRRLLLALLCYLNCAQRFDLITAGSAISLPAHQKRDTRTSTNTQKTSKASQSIQMKRPSPWRTSQSRAPPSIPKMEAEKSPLSVNRDLQNVALVSKSPYR